MLAGDRAGAGHALLQDRGDRLPLTCVDRGDQQLQPVAYLGEQGEYGVGVGRDDLLPQPRVAGRDPGDVANPLAAINLTSLYVLSECALT